MMGILPVSNKAKWARCRKTNALNAALAYNNDEVVYLDLQDKFLQTDGWINKRLFTDGTHLTPAGYRLWAQSLEPIVSKIMKAEPLDPVRIMLIGGSITEGVNSSCSYRRYLDGMLRRAGHLIDFVGSRKKHNDNKTQADSYEYDVDHEGHWGKGSGWLAENMPALIADNVPDVAVIHMGTKDIVSGSGGAEKILGDIGKVINALRSKNKTVKIVLAKIIPAKSKADEIKLLNRRIAQYAKAHSTARSPVLIADQHSDFDAASDLADDGVSPNAAGAEKMAAMFARVINKMLGDTNRK
jgi:lysophospholipase L1-like esterase